VLKNLGKGGMGSVEHVKNKEDGKEYALKVMKKSHLKKKRVCKGEFAYDLALQEIDIMKTLEHPNIIKLHEIINDESADDINLIMDLHLNGTLKGAAKNSETGLDYEKSR
jgi:[calcium/calmodulin-dependent protein kinase] kinase